MKKKRHFLWLLYVCVFSFSILLLGQATLSYGLEMGKQVVTVRVGVPDWPGLFQVDEDGKRSGMCYDFLMELEKYHNWSYEFIDGNPEELMEMLKSGSIDLMGGLPKGKEEELLYSSNPAGILYSMLAAPIGNTQYPAGNFSSLQGASIGVYRPDEEMTESLLTFCQTNDIQMEIRYYDDKERYEKCAVSGETDLRLTRDLVESTHREEMTLAAFDPQLLYFAVAPGKESLIQEINFSLHQVYGNHPNINQDLWHMYFQDDHSGDQILTQEEMEYAAAREPVRIAVNMDMKPVQYMENGKLSGMLSQILEHISQSTGLGFQAVPTQSVMESIELLQEGKVDMVSGLIKAGGYDQRLNMSLSIRYFESQLVMLKKRELPLEGLLESGQAALPIAVLDAPNVERMRINYYPTELACMDAVVSGEADYTYANFFVAQYYGEENKLNGVDMVGTAHTSGDQYFGFSSPVDPVLYQIINKGIQGITDLEMQNLTYQEMMKAPRSFSLVRYISDHPWQSVLLAVLACALVFAVIFLTAARRQQRRLKESMAKQQEYEENIRDALASARSANQAKTEFLSHISHEIRTPLNGIMGMTNLALSSKDSPALVGDYLQKVLGASSHLMSLLNDILDMTRIENGKITLENVIIEKQELLDGITSIIGQQAKAKGVEFEARYGENIAAVMVGDQLKLRQILLNLLSNAVKFTDPGGKVSLLAEDVSREGNTLYTRFVVQDNGAGMSGEFQKRIFLPFEQEKTGREKQGTGLGLAITKNFVEMMGGHIELQSKEGEGSRFTVSLCFDIPTEEEVNAEREAGRKKELEEIPDFSGRHVLLAEDNELNLEIEVMMLRQVHLEAEVARDGQEAVDKFRSSPEHFYQLILMDIMMPEKDGLEATKEIRAMNRADAKTVPIYAMSANAFSGDVAKSLASGMDAHMTKPLEPRQLYEKLAECFSSSPKGRE